MLLRYCNGWWLTIYTTKTSEFFMFVAWQWDTKWTSISWNWSLWWFSTYWLWHRCFKSKWGWHYQLYRRNRKNSFLPIPDCQLKEAQAIQQHLCQQPDHITMPTAGHEPTNEHITPFLATLAFPTMFPDASGDPTNPALLWDLSFAERVKHLIKFGGKKRYPVGLSLCHTPKICLLGI